MMLAQTIPNALYLQEFWIIIAFFAAVGSNLVTCFVLLRNRAQKREISFTAEAAFVSAAESGAGASGSTSRISARKSVYFQSSIRRLGSPVSS